MAEKIRLMEAGILGRGHKLLIIRFDKPTFDFKRRGNYSPAIKTYFKTLFS